MVAECPNFRTSHCKNQTARWTDKQSTTLLAYQLYLDLKEDDQDQYVLYLWYKESSDDFDPNNTKASRNQVWRNTFTICPPEGENQGRNSYFMWLSSKGEDHSEIEIQFQKELNALSNKGKMFYHGGLKRIIKVKMGNFFFVLIDQKELPFYKLVIIMEPFPCFGDIVVKGMDTAKKTNYHPAKNVKNTVLTGLLLEKTLNLMRQICFLSVMEQIIFLLNAIRERIPYKHAMEENVHHGMSFILHLNFVYQQIIPPTMTNGLMPHCLLTEGRLIYSLWSVILATLFSATGGNFSAIHVEYVDFVPELDWRFRSRNL